ncbi:hypothetical protein C6W96_14910 [Streptomyces sp. CS149]|uniref:hypothetical protein n=1 Tax=Streptomyces TaxID=1883 RepID=UPI00081D341C|nr:MULTISPECIES: hypothetical protein [unclassified Streptomyces]MCC8476876.1 hypothetical protein [Streptomyces globisporus]MYV63467.1 hypothetical protein [Streptomyces sp. SID4931]SCG07852.1 hypothetical protein GA0115255_123202 [Streptomyces sp. Ncost-T6T-2b]NUV71915.1 hypothetical protein [Streptomyces sp. CAI-121]NUW03696.1 hypothetical protein [Streptomyces sp. CAI 127]
MRYLKQAATVAALTATIGLGFSTPASAADSDYENWWFGCNYDSANNFKFRIHYNSNLGGDYRNIGYAVYDFGYVYQGPLKYCGFKSSGSGQNVKNNAASARNSHATYTGVLYYNSGYKGAADYIWGTVNQLDATYNDNASFNWKS